MNCIQDIDIRNKTVLARVDYNEPVDDEGVPQDDFRICSSVETIRYILDQGGKAVLMTHLGRPGGKVVEVLRLDKIAEKLGSLLEEKVEKFDEVVNSEMRESIQESSSRVFMLENLRFRIEEEKNGEGFAKQLAGLGDVYVNEAFSNSHRDHASMTGVPELLPSCAGFNLQKEVETLTSIRENPKRPFTFIVGGAKLKTKLGLLKYMIGQADNLLVGGKLANTLLAATGMEIASDQLEGELLSEAKNIVEKISDGKIYLPVDTVVEKGKGIYKKDVAELTRDDKIFDIGARTAEVFSEVIQNSEMVVWNGPMGKFENPKFLEGTRAIAESVTSFKGETIVGGGETVDVLGDLGIRDKIGYVSTGGAAMLEFLENGTLIALQDLGFGT